MSSARLPRYWLADQLPRPLAEDPFLRRLSLIFEDLADFVRDPVLGFEHFLDADTAPPEFLPWLAGWLGLSIDRSLDESKGRALLRSAGALYQWRGTKRGLQGLLESLVGGPVEIVEHGGVFREGQTPSYDPRIAIRLDRSGGIDERRLRAFVEFELPAGAELDLVVGKPPAIAEPDHSAPHGDESADREDESEQPAEPPSEGGDE